MYISTKKSAISFSRKQFKITYGDSTAEKLYAKQLNDSTWYVTSYPEPVTKKGKMRSFHFGGKSLKFDRKTCKIIVITRWK